LAAEWLQHSEEDAVNAVPAVRHDGKEIHDRVSFLVHASTVVAPAIPITPLAPVADAEAPASPFEPPELIGVADVPAVAAFADPPVVRPLVPLKDVVPADELDVVEARPPFEGTIPSSFGVCLESPLEHAINRMVAMAASENAVGRRVTALTQRPMTENVSFEARCIGLDIGVSPELACRSIDGR